MEEQTSFEKFRYWLRTSVTVRLTSIGILILLMLIPISFIESLISDRQYTKESAVNEISQKWGKQQTLTGPVISFPFQVSEQVWDSKTEKYKTQLVQQYAHLLPEMLNITADVQTETRHRGIYDAVVYKTVVKVEGTFNTAEIAKLGIDETMDTQKAVLTQGLSDLRNLKSVTMTFNGKTYEFDPGVSSADVISSGISTRTPFSKDDTAQVMVFSYTLEFNGSTSINFIPVGKQTHVKLTSNSVNPKFDGAFLPDNHDITKDGFIAEWQVFHLNRNYPQAFTGAQFGIAESAFGAELLIGVDEYQKNTRAAKYAILFIMLTFMTYFFMQTGSGIDIHFIQYLLVGFALAIFYVLLISLSEHISFSYAYLIGAVAVISLITGYSHSVLKSKKLTMITGLILTILYAFIFVIIQLQNYSLLVGAIGLFIVIAAAMFASRNIDWYSLGKKNLNN